MAEAEKPASSQLSIIVRLGGVVILAVVAGVHLGALGQHRMPPGAPWSGLTLSILGLRAIVWPVGSTSEQGKWADIAFTLLALISAAMWMYMVS